jgi:hypothetical protein
MRWYQKEMKGYIVGFWVTNSPLVSKRVSEILGNEEDSKRLANACRNKTSFKLSKHDK